MTDQTKLHPVDTQQTKASTVESVIALADLSVTSGPQSSILKDFFLIFIDPLGCQVCLP